MSGGELRIIHVAGVLLLYRILKSRGREPTANDDDTALALMSAEYESIRQEVTVGQQVQHVVLQWSLAGFAAIFAAGLLVGFDSQASQEGSARDDLLLVVFGLALPGLVFAAYLAWTGELVRVQRAGRFLRGLEGHLASTLRTSHPAIRDGPLRWETYLAHRSRARRLLLSARPQVGYIGGLLVYFGAFCFSLLIFITALRVRDFGKHDALFKLIGVGYAVMLVIVFFLIAVWLIRGIQKMASEIVAIGDLSPVAELAEQAEIKTVRWG